VTAAAPVTAAPVTTAAPLPGAVGAGALLQMLRDGRPRTRAELITETGLARSTVAARLEGLLATRLLLPAGEAASTGGRPAARFAFNPSAQVVLAADLGATHATVALTDLAGRVLRESTRDLDITTGPGPVLDWVLGEGLSHLRAEGRSATDVAGVGIGVPGPVEHSTGRPTNPPIMPGWDGFDIPATVRTVFDGPVLVDNDVNIMALGEHASAFPAVEHLVFVKVATGIGAGIVSGGRLNRGAQGAAGDLGHVEAHADPTAQCTCGNLGCLEAVASGPAIARRLRHEVTAASTRDVVALVRAGDVPTRQAVRQAGREIGRVLASVVSLLNPSVIVVGGNLAQAAEPLLAGLREVVYARSLPLATGQLQIVEARTGDQAGVIGAATMVIQHVLSPAQVDAQVAAALSAAG
jgi:predicted NBD/HSP70 family sugar kinase